MDKIPEIKAEINKFETDTNWLKLRSRWDNDFDLWRLKPYNAGKGYYSYTTNAPMNFFNKAVSMISTANLIIRVPLDNLTDPERETANNIERLLYGSFDFNDKEQKMTEGASIQAQLAWTACMRGANAVRVFCYKGEDGKTHPEVCVWDIYHVAYGRGKAGVQWATYTKTITLDEAQATYPDLKLKKGVNRNSTVSVVDFWDDKNNGIIVGEEWAKEPTPHGLDYCPVYIIRVGSMPQTSHQLYQFTDVHRGESVFAPNRNIYPVMNKTLSDRLTMLRRGVKVPLVYHSPDGSKNIEEDVYQVEKAAMIPLAEGESIEELIKPVMPADTDPSLAWMSGDEQRGAFPNTAYGELSFRLSGYAINQLNAALETIISPFLTTVETSVEVCCEELLKQYASKKFPALKLRGTTSRGETFGYPKPLTIKPADLKKDWLPQVRLEAVMPTDDAQKMLLAKEASIHLSEETIMDTILGVKDPSLEKQKKNLEWAENLPTIRLYKAYLQAIADGRPDIAQNLMLELQFLMAQQGRAPMAGKAPAPTGALASEAMGMAGAGVPSGETGMPSSVMPPEQAGGFPAGALGAK